MNVGKVYVDEEFEPSLELEADMERLPHVADALTDLVFRETPTVAVSALVSVLGRVLLAAGGDPIKEAGTIGAAVEVMVRRNLHAVPRSSSSLN